LFVQSIENFIKSKSTHLDILTILHRNVKKNAAVAS
jgi:hypothetical protein